MLLRQAASRMATDCNIQQSIDLFVYLRIYPSICPTVFLLCIQLCPLTVRIESGSCLSWTFNRDMAVWPDSSTHAILDPPTLKFIALHEHCAKSIALLGSFKESLVCCCVFCSHGRVHDSLCVCHCKTRSATDVITQTSVGLP